MKAFGKTLCIAGTVMLVAAIPAAAQTDLAERCAQLAANPLDLATPAGTGIADDDLDLVAAKEACTAAANAPDATARTHYMLGRILSRSSEFEAAAAQFLIAVDGGQSIAMNALGLAFEFGEGVDADEDKALALYRQAFETDGLPAAAANLGYAYANGVGVQIDYAAAISYYEVGAEAGIAWATNELGLMHENGEGVDVDYLKAAQYYKDAYKQGDPIGANNLGVLYDNGNGFAEDDVQAVHFFQLAANAGNKHGLFNLAYMYAHGEGGLERDGEKAIEFYLESADAGLATGWSAAAAVYATGTLVPQDLTRARELHQKAIDSRNTVAIADGYDGLAWANVLENVDLDQALELVQKSLESDPEVGSYQDTMAWILHLQGKSAAALPYALHAVELDDYAGNYAHLGDILVALGRPDKARKAYQSAVDGSDNILFDSTVDIDAIKDWLASSN